ncbi:N-acetylglucosamine transferase [Phenylobacterium sp.]|jgi:predicted O-linked N-acetylglucosamine transferase (SPINDLY family)|uniref:O-linked N-acetylglucosamine transferase, SPINDLY family protein n=1 Tax=Phenylobacterium sp. TaxID=1871053 RepID=UPI002F92653C
MSDEPFLVAVQKVTAGGVSLAEVINWANELAQRGQAGLAQQLYKIWINFNREHPQLFVAHFNMSVVATAAGDIGAAMEALKSALAVNGDFLPAYINLGGLLEKAGTPDQAIELWKTAITKLQPITGPSVGWKIATLKQIGRLLGEHQKLDTAETALQECLTLNGNQRDVIEQLIAMRLGQCKWPVVVPFEGVDRKAQVSAIHPLSMAAYTDDPLLQLASSWRYTGQLVDEEQDLGRSDRRHAPAPANRRLRIGYVSSDLRDHAIGYLMAELFEVHDRSKVEVFAYYCGRPSSGEGLQQRIKAAVEHWVDIREMTDDEAAARIAADGVDILVDVNGHTRDARTAVFARRPAPIQVNWLGFPSTMGSPYHHYIIADDWIVPEGSEIYYSEKVLRLPCYQSNDRRRVVAPERPTRAQFGLPDDAVVFCCFNGVQKINTFTFGRWMEVLKRTPGSVLWLLEASPEANERLRAEAERHGVDRARLHFAPKLANPWHLARYPLADLFLDTAPYGAHTTCSDALWMGVPIVTLSGKSFASRVCGSLVRAAGLPELVVESPEAFVDLAVRLGNDPAAIADMKARLEAGRATCTLFDMDLLVDRLEGLYAEMADDYRAGRLPKPDLANMEAYLAVGVAQDHEGREMLAHPDYLALYRNALARKHRVRPLAADTRLWTQAHISATEAPPAEDDEQPLRRAASA